MTHYPLTHVDGSADKRYSIAKEFCGHADRRWVLRFCGEFVKSSISFASVAIRAAGHRSALNGQVIFEEVRA
ncbi:hypothetical protein KEU06_09365 [Pseudaminobacter sp. 19-2017]|uniref:Uncharacterized protein n=1 Tax=Pseudaminobacter soli (ex Zhang et al. 2022) TaxID=2831468 RepID=A0A942I2I9_9HYPH|nr:hypothetical protein [Pseudaminobacter soli]MBS3648813.1 hypothetical protein [Pseudaminobacter soli]